MSVLSLEVILGGLTVTGSLMAAGKLQEVLPQRPITYKGQNFVNLGVLAIAVGVAVYLVNHPVSHAMYPFIVAVALIFGVMLIVPIGGADMPTVISLLNSYAGLSAAAMGFVLDNKLLIIAGALDGASGLILSVNMSQGHEPLVHQRAVRRIRPGQARRRGRGRSAQRAQRDAEEAAGDSGCR